MKKILLFCITLLFVFIGLIVKFCYFNDGESNKITVKFSTWGSKTELDILKTVLSEFESKNPKIKVKLIHIPQNYFQKIHMLFAAGIEPDVIFINNQNIQIYINAGLLENLSPYFGDILSDFHSQALDCFKKDGIQYAIPRDISNLVIYYNKDIFRQKGVKMPNKIQDIFELRKLALMVKSENNYSINFEDNPLFWLYYAASNGGGIISDDKKKIIINNSKTIEALNLYSDMINKDKTIPSKAQMANMTSAQMFINSKIAMYLSGRWMIPKFREIINFDWDVIEFPAPNKVYIDSSAWAISKNSKHKEQAVSLIKFLSGYKTSIEFTRSGLIVPARKDVFSNEDNKKPLNSKSFTNMISNTKPTPVIENYSALMDFIKEKTENIFNGTKNAKDVFDEKTIKEMENLLEKSL